MNKLFLIHNKDTFLLEINNTPIKSVQQYEIKADVENKPILELTLKMLIDIGKSSININDIETNLR